MSAQTADWSDVRSPQCAIDRETCAIRLARPVAYCVRGAVANRLDFARQRPASTHDTGMISSDSAATRIVRFTTRFCFAPTSSSPSMMRVGLRPRLTIRSSGTTPFADTSVISDSLPTNGIVQGHVVDRLHRGSQQRKHQEVLEYDRVADGDGGEGAADGVTLHITSIGRGMDRGGHGFGMMWSTPHAFDRHAAIGDNCTHGT